MIDKQACVKISKDKAFTALPQGLQQIFRDRLCWIDADDHHGLERWQKDLAWLTAKQPAYQNQALPIKSPPKVVIGILIYNGWKDTEALMESMNKITTLNVEVVLLDNGSKDTDQLHRLARFGSSGAYRLTLMRSPINLGFDEGHNVIFDYALDKLEADYVMSLNNDMIVAPDFIDKMLPAFDNPPKGKRVGIVGPTVYAMNEDELTDTVLTAGAIPFQAKPLRWSGTHDDNMKQNGYRDVGWILGMALLFDCQALRHVGGWDPRYFAYWEELDMTCRMEAANYIQRVTPARVWHREAKSSGGMNSPLRSRESIRNLFLTVRKHPPMRHPFALARMVIAITACFQRSWSRAIRKHELESFLAPLQGLFYGIIGRVYKIQAGQLEVTSIPFANKTKLDPHDAAG